MICIRCMWFQFRIGQKGIAKILCSCIEAIITRSKTALYFLIILMIMRIIESWNCHIYNLPITRGLCRYVPIELHRASSCLSQSHLLSYWRLSFLLVLGVGVISLYTGRDNKIRTFSHICRLCLCSGFLLHTLTTQSQKFHFRYLFWKCVAKILSFENQNMTHNRYRILLSRPVYISFYLNYYFALPCLLIVTSCASC